MIWHLSEREKCVGSWSVAQLDMINAASLPRVVLWSLAGVVEKRGRSQGGDEYTSEPGLVVK
jgi:hypothetical protein